ncbi:MAG: hypothetical protein E7310_05175 [Clostridiales bacterium]|nr:hypothetical protein [Clostridiales bacterium]
MSISKDKIDSLIKKAQIGDRGYFRKVDGKEYCVAKKWKNSVGEYKNFVYLVSVDYISNLDKAIEEELGTMLNAEWLYKEYDIVEFLSNEQIGLNRYLYVFDTKEKFESAYTILSKIGQVEERFINNEYAIEFKEPIKILEEEEEIND